MLLEKPAPKKKAGLVGATRKAKPEAKAPEKVDNKSGDKKAAAAAAVPNPGKKQGGPEKQRVELF